MKQLNKKATATFTKIVQGLNEPGDAKRIGDKSSGFMPLSVECVDTWGRGSSIR